LITFVETLEQALGKTTSKELLPLQPGDVVDTYADIGSLTSVTGYQPKTSLDEGVAQFAHWYLEYFGQA
jgi:UDP-glucuronate 4-epimerase